MIFAKMEAKPFPIAQRFKSCESKSENSEARIARVVATKYPLISTKQRRDKLNPVSLSSSNENNGIAIKAKIAIKWLLTRFIFTLKDLYFYE